MYEFFWLTDEQTVSNEAVDGSQSIELSGTGRPDDGTLRQARKEVARLRHDQICLKSLRLTLGEIDESQLSAGLVVAQRYSIACLVVGALLKFVVPIFANMFISMGVDLPLPTHIVILLSNFVGRFWWLMIISLVFVFVGVKYIRKDPKGRYMLDKFLLNLPVLGQVLRKIAVARFTRTLGTLITSGVPILEGLSITARTSGNAVLEDALMKFRLDPNTVIPN